MALRSKGDTRPYTAAVIGCGRVGSLLARDKLRHQPSTHAGIYAAHPRVRLIAGCDRRASRRAEFACDWGLPAFRVYADHRQMLEEMRPDIVSIATYTDSHAEITIAAARAGASIILCEKPMARTLAEADRMIEVCLAEGAVLGVHHERRWSRIFREARRIISSGEIGEVRTVIGNVLTGAPHPDWHARPEVSGGGPTLHDGTHLFDAIRYLCGEIAAISGRTERKNPDLLVEDTGYAVMRLANGGIVFVECGGRRKYFNFELDIQCSRGRIQIGNAVLRLWTVGPSPRYEGFTEFSERVFPVGWKPDDYFPFIVDELMDAYDSSRPSLSDGHEGRAALDAVLQVYSGKGADLPSLE
ncbi:MAG: Gfo/Idh/MocA family oxidoreductase [Candidatus Hydrogenedentota bacterium]